MSDCHDQILLQIQKRSSSLRLSESLTSVSVVCVCVCVDPTESVSSVCLSPCFNLSARCLQRVWINTHIHTQGHMSNYINASGGITGSLGLSISSQTLHFFSSFCLFCLALKLGSNLWMWGAVPWSVGQTVNHFADESIDFLAPKMTSLNVLFCQQHKYIQFTVRGEKRNQKRSHLRSLNQSFGCFRV